jgi:outer membrane protein insertion porin family
MKSTSARFLAALVVASCVVLGDAARAQESDDAINEYEAYRGLIVKAITFGGTHVTEDFVVTREIWTDVGKPLDPHEVSRDIARLQNLSIFGSVEVTAREKDSGVVLNYQFTEMPWLIPYPAISYTEENGFSIGVGLASPNFGGKGVNLSGSAVFGGTSTFNFGASNPWITGNHVSASVKAWHKTRDNVLLQFREITNLASFKLGTYLGENGRLQGGVTYYGLKSDRDSITLTSDNSDHILNVAFLLGYDSRDSWRVPHEGWEAELVPLFYGGDANSWGLQFDARRYQPVAPRHTIATGPLLTLQSGTVDVDLPSYFQYFMGGVNSIRGYRLEELGREIFGKNQFLYTLEYRYVLSPLKAYKIFKWTVGFGFELAAFGDMGVAWSTTEELSWDRTHFGYGVGFRVLAPGVGSVRFDMGVSQYGDMVFSFGVGSIFEARSKKVR